VKIDVDLDGIYKWICVGSKYFNHRRTQILLSKIFFSVSLFSFIRILYLALVAKVFFLFSMRCGVYVWKETII